MKIILKSICDQAFHSAETGNLNIIGIFENVVVGNFPAIHSQIVLVCILEGDPAESFEYSVNIQNSNGKKIGDISQNKQKGQVGINGKGHLIYNLKNIPFSEEGVYRLILSIGQQEEIIEFNVLSALK